MADKKAPSPSEDGHTTSYKILSYLFILIVLSGFITKLGLDSYFESVNSKLESQSVFNDTENNIKDDSSFGLTDFFAKGNISLGKNVINKKDVEVRNEPAGQLLGLQKKGELAKVLEGPVLKNKIDWWRVDYKNAPDGWISGSNVTSYVIWFNVLNFFPWLFSGIQKILILIGILAFILIIIVYIKISNLKTLNKKKEDLKKEQNNIPSQNVSKNISNEEDLVLPIPGLPIGEPPATEDVSNRRWKNIQTLIHSHNLNDWRQAIIEADIMLDEMLDKMGYHGDSIGDKLKQIEPSDFLTLNQAWEAHKVRNQIAHKGGNYILSKDEAERVISLYTQVFKEFYYI